MNQNYQEQQEEKYNSMVRQYQSKEAELSSELKSAYESNDMLKEDLRLSVRKNNEMAKQLRAELFLAYPHNVEQISKDYMASYEKQIESLNELLERQNNTYYRL